MLISTLQGVESKRFSGTAELLLSVCILKTETSSTAFQQMKKKTQLFLPLLL